MTLNKSLVMDYDQCPKKLWLHKNRPELDTATDQPSLPKMWGAQVGQEARNQFPDGIMLPSTMEIALSETRRLFAEGVRQPLFEAAFEVGGLRVRADILVPDGQDWHLIEVKSSGSVKEHHYLDTSVQAWAVEQYGIRLSKILLAHVDTTTVISEKVTCADLIKYADITREVRQKFSEIPSLVSTATQLIRRAEPYVEMGDQCEDPYDCPFMDYCESLEVRYPVKILGSKKLQSALRADGYSDLREIPEGRLTEPKHVRMWQAIRDGAAVLDPAAKEKLQGLAYPRYYVDFESIQYAMPIFNGTKPHQQITFQWSCHIEDANGHIDHQYFLADSPHDPRRQFSETLISALGNTGPVFVYSAFEKTQLRNLSAAFPDLAENLQGIIDRLVDLYTDAKNYYYHPAMKKSWSIKSVLPTIAPDLAYDGLAVANGMMAQQAYLEMMAPLTSPERRDEIRTGLLTYCQRDTEAMVRIAHYFQGH